MIHCFGNSHVNTFSDCSELSFVSNNNLFVLHHIGPVIAYNFYEHHFKHIIEKLSSVDKENDYISIIVGEVDCRLHLPKHADIQQVSDYVVVKNCVEKLKICYNDLISLGYKCVIFSTHPTTSNIHDDLVDFIYGNVVRRNNICVLWNSVCKDMCRDLNIPFVDFYDILVDTNNNTKMEYFLDYCHLNSSLIFDQILDRTTSVLKLQIEG